MEVSHTNFIDIYWKEISPLETTTLALTKDSSTATDTIEKKRYIFS